MKTNAPAASLYENLTDVAPCHGGTCYACGEVATGLRDRRPEGGELEVACSRHADPTIRCYRACVYCDGRVRAGSLVIEREHAHKACHTEACS